MSKITQPKAPPALYSIVLGDIAQATDLLIQVENDCMRRAVVRAIMSGIEGLLWDIKRSLLTRASLFSGGDLQYLREIAYEVRDNGEVREIAKFIPLRTNLKALHSLIVRSGIEAQPCFEGLGWTSMVASVEVRNRITHPKSPQDLHVTEKEVTDAIRAFSWFFLFTAQRFIALRRKVEDCDLPDESMLEFWGFLEQVVANPSHRLKDFRADGHWIAEEAPAN